MDPAICIYGLACLLAAGLITLIVSRRRRKIEYHVLSSEGPLEALVWMLLLGGALCVFAIGFYPKLNILLDKSGLKNEAAGAIVVTLFVAPALMLLAYWKRLDEARDKIPQGAEMLASEKLTQRLAGVFFLERIARESSTIFPTVVEILCAHIRSRAVDSPKGSAETPEVLKEVETKQCVDIISRLWRYNIWKRNSLWNYNANLRPDLKKVNLAGLELPFVDLNQFYLYKSDLSGCRLDDANFYQADLTDARCTGARVKDACLCGADFSGADMGSAVLDGARLYGTNLSGCGNLTQEQIEKALGDDDTRLPPGLIRPGSWRKVPLRTCLPRFLIREFARPSCPNCDHCRLACVGRGASLTPR